MDNLFFLVFFIPVLILLALVALIVFAVVAWRRRAFSPPDDPGIGTARRLYFYVVSFAALMMVANGVVQIIRFLLNDLFGPAVISANASAVAWGVSLIVVGLPLWAFHWRLILRHLARLPVERRSIIRKAYVYIVLGVSVGLIIVSLTDVLRWLFGGEAFSGYHWAAMIVWPAVWALHWRMERAEGQPTEETRTIRRLYVYPTALAGLAMVTVAAFRLMGMVLVEGYDALFSVPVILPTTLWHPGMQSAAALLLVGGATWAVHWLYLARGDFSSMLRQVYLYVFAVLGGVIATLVALGYVIFGVLAWLVGVPSIESATVHFRFLPHSVAGLGVGVGLWAYHWWAATRQEAAGRDEVSQARRAYAYILAALGLGALGIAIGTLVNTALVTLIETSRPLISGEDLWREPIALSIALALLGGPVWGYFWAGAQRRVRAGDSSERSSTARRIYIFAALGAGMLALLGSVSAVLFLFLRDALDSGGVNTETFRDLRPAFDILAAVVVFLPYHWLVYRQDTQAEPEDALAPTPPPVTPVTKDVTVLALDTCDPFVERLETALGYSVNIHRWADPDARSPELTSEATQELAATIAAAAGDRVLVVPDGDEVRVLSYR